MNYKIAFGIIMFLMSLNAKGLDTEKDSIKIFDTYYTSSDLDNVSNDFLRYARNYFFAKQGYAFKDDCLNDFFNSLDWYLVSSNTISLSNEEKEWIRLIKEKEEVTREVPATEEIMRSNFNGRPLFYIASDLNPRYPNSYQKYRTGHFYLLPKSESWVLQFNDIPIEIIEMLSIDKVRCDDEGSIKSKDIKIINIDSLCINGHYSEILVSRYGISSDPNSCFIGYNSDNNLQILIKRINSQGFVKKNDSIVIFTSIDRCDRIGTEFCEIEYYFNSITKQLSKTTQPEYKHSISTKSRIQEVIVYKSEEDVINKTNKVAFRLKPDSNVKISHYLDRKNLYQIEYKNKIGWISYDQLHYFNVSFAD